MGGESGGSQTETGKYGTRFSGKLLILRGKERRKDGGGRADQEFINTTTLPNRKQKKELKLVREKKGHITLEKSSERVKKTNLQLECTIRIIRSALVPSDFNWKGKGIKSCHWEQKGTRKAQGNCSYQKIQNDCDS